MGVYVIAQISITDSKHTTGIRQGFWRCLENSKVSYWQRIQIRKLLKANGNGDKLILMSFPDDEAFERMVLFA